MMHSSSRFRELLGRLTAFKVVDWGPNSQEPDLKAREVADLKEAHVTSSLIKDTTYDPDEPYRLRWPLPVADGRHHVVLDIDHPVHVEESSTPGNYHLYIEVGDGIAWADYLKFLEAAASINLIEPGYLMASKHRKHTDVRLPWVNKHEGNLSIEQQKEATLAERVRKQNTTLPDFPF